jgi:hypothetical protein
MVEGTSLLAEMEKKWKGNNTLLREYPTTEMRILTLKA